MRSSRLIAVLILCICITVGGTAASPQTAAQSTAVPSLTLEPNQAPCGTTIQARGSNFPAGTAVELALPEGGPRPTATTGAAGDFALAIIPCTAATPGADQDGTQYTIAAITPTTDPFVAAVAYATAGFTVGPVAQLPVPTLMLVPESGACNSPAIVSGTNWFPGDILALTAFPVGSDSGVGFVQIRVGADGTFSLPIEMSQATLCSASNAPPIGTQYRIGVGSAPKLGSSRRDFAMVFYTIDRERLTERCFPETGQCVRGTFLDRWERHGLADNGFPLTGEFRQTLEDGNEYTVQYFERVRMEQHPENQSPYDVLLGQFGRHILASVPDAPTAPAAPQPGQTYFEATGHNVAPDFAAYWATNGGLAGFGLPLTEEFDEFIQTGAPGEGRVFRVQYFERARFERHPENAPPYDILLGQFGRRILDEQRHPSVPPGVPAIVPTRPDAPPGEPTYTETDVRAYLAQHGLPLIKVQIAGPYTIERVEFMTAAVAEQTRDVTLGPPPDRLYCLVTVRGTFTITGPPLPDSTPNVHTLTQLILFFDGRTGNALGTQGKP